MHEYKTNIHELRRLALCEAERELIEYVLPCPPLPGTWIGMNAQDQKSTLQFVSMKVTLNPDSKKTALLNLLQSLNDDELDEGAGERATQSFLATIGMDRDQFPDENLDLLPEDRLMEIMFSRKRRPQFYFEVEALTKYLDDKTAGLFRSAVGS